MRFYAHTKEEAETKRVLPKEEWQLLVDHLESVAQLTEARAGKFGADKLGRIAGTMHDIGKYSAEFQRRLEGARGKVDHSTAGAQEIYQQYSNPVGKALAYIIAGHHGGLPDGNKGDPGNLPERLTKEGLPDYRAFRTEITIPELSDQDLRDMPKARDKSMGAFSFAFCIRMLFSCLTDADYLDTERHMDPCRFGARPAAPPLRELLTRLEGKLSEVKGRNGATRSLINGYRTRILERCLAMAPSSPGMYTLTVPTGGGKTYSSLAFALKHGVIHGKDRVIYVIPYTSIIEQNAQVFREALEEPDGRGNVVLEHHSNFEYPEGSFSEWDGTEKGHRLAAENWDMPVVVTTAVQFFESLYANRGSRCRKLHNMVNSVIVLDEAQLVPVEFMRPCLWALAELVLNYGATVILCTATQPAIERLLPAGLTPVEIMEDPEELQRVFKRVETEYAGALSDDGIAAAMAAAPQVLAVVNTRRHARLLFDKLQGLTEEGIYHLSARMCPAHRKAVIAEIRRRLREGTSCRVVSTQLIEAGVDLDFPLVYRSMAGVDSIAQAAGRCNREGRLSRGRVVVFDPEAHGMPTRGRFGLVAGLARSTARHIDRYGGELLSLGAITDYFRSLFAIEEATLDAKGILPKLNMGKDGAEFPFAEVAKDFQIIDAKTATLVVPWDESARELMERAESSPYPGSFARVFQPYAVQIYSYELKGLERAGAIKSVGGMLTFLTDPSFYDNRFGIREAKEVKGPEGVLLF